MANPSLLFKNNLIVVFIEDCIFIQYIQIGCAAKYLLKKILLGWKYYSVT